MIIALKSCSRLLRNFFGKTFNYGQQRCINSPTRVLWFKRQNSGFQAWGETEQYLKKKDGVADNYQLIYRAPMPNYIIWTMHVINPLNVIFAGACAYYCFQGVPFGAMKISEQLESYDSEIYVYLLYYVILNVVLRLVVSMYALRIYKDADRYLAIYYSDIPGKCNHHNFTKGAVSSINLLFNPWNHITFKLGTRNSIIFPNYFKTLSEFHAMF